MDKTIKTLTEVLQESKKEGTTPYDTTAEVVRIEGNTAWVHIPGGIDETPVSMTIDARAGDIVQVRVSGGRAWITGNQSAPPTDDTIAKEARTKANSAEVIAVEASELSESAKTQAEAAARVAGNTSQHFWFTGTGADTGAHITEVDKDTWDLDPSNGGGNLLARSNGVAIRDGMIELATLQQSGLDVNTDDGQGNLVNIAHLGYEEGQAEAGTAVTPYASLGTRKETTAIYDSSVTYSKGDLCIYNDKMYVCRSSMSQPEPWTQGRWQLAVGNYSVAGGYNNVAGGAYSVALGANNLALGKFAYAEGSGTSAQDWGHAEGSGTNAGIYAHAEGAATKANGNYSHAQNEGTQALSAAQTAIGKYNIPDSNGDYAVIVGNGINGSPSNALTVEWSGDVVAAGDITDGGGNVLANKLNASALADYVIQRGTSGNWKYIKWASGRVECEGWYTFSSLTFSAASNVYRSVSNAFTIPSGIFTTAPGEGQAWIQGSNTDLIGASIGGMTTTGGNCQVWKRNSGNLTNIAVHMRLVYRG